jgi:uncharacterized membrane protein YeiH
MSVLLIRDLAGTFVFCIQRSERRSDPPAEFVRRSVTLFVAGNFGGITRDVLIGSAPPPQ